jgi:hypothetical protein
MRRNKEPLDVKVIYLNTRKNVKSTIERMIVNYNSQNNGTKLVFHHCTDSKEII